MTKICTKCGKPGQFYVYKGKEYSECKTCFLRRSKLIRGRKQYILILEHGGKCARCGYDEHVEILQFHHRNPQTKEFDISTRNGRSLARLRTEAEKCELLCPNCHAVEHGSKIIGEMAERPKAAVC